jgi:hyperosmotically inducible periplasmic protein
VDASESQNIFRALERRGKPALKANRKGDRKMHRTSKIGKCLSLLGATLFFSASLIAGTPQQEQPPAPDNSKTNQGDASKGATTAQQQKMDPADRNITKQIRSSIIDDKSLSTYAHNIKIITQDGKVTLKGPVRSADDKASIEAKAVAVAGADNVTNQLRVAPANQ